MEIGGPKQNIGKFLAHKFFSCQIGIEDFEYDEDKELLKLHNKLVEKIRLEEVVVKVEIGSR